MTTTNVTYESAVLNLRCVEFQARDAAVVNVGASLKVTRSARGLSVAIGHSHGLELHIEPLVESLSIQEFTEQLVDEASLQRAQDDVAAGRTISLEELTRELEDRVRRRGQGQD